MFDERVGQIFTPYSIRTERKINAAPGERSKEFSGVTRTFGPFDMDIG
jgi:hypothetical protein